jgi:hypothetical protein
MTQQSIEIQLNSIGDPKCKEPMLTELLKTLALK